MHIALVSEADGRIAAYGLLSRNGTIALLYVAHEGQLKGAGRVLLAEMESRSRQLGLSTLKLSSSAAARRLNESRGLDSAGPPEPAFCASTNHLMAKQLGPALQ